MSRDFELMIKNPHVFCFIIMAVCLFAGCFNLKSSVDSEDYIETTGEICNVKTKEVRRRQRYETRCSYDVVWYVDGEKHTEHLSGQMDYQEEGEITLWVSPDGDDFRFTPSEEIKKDIPRDFWIALIAGIIGVIISVSRYSKMDKSRTQLIKFYENFKTYGGLGFIFSGIGIAIYIAAEYNAYKKTETWGYGMGMVIVTFVLCAVGSLIAYLIGRHNLKKMGE